MSAAGVESVAILLTPPGSAAIAVIRLVGAGNAGFAKRHLSREPKRLRCVHCDLTDSAGEVVDDIVVVETADGHLDLNLHGGPWVVQAALRLAEENGYRVVPWNESAEAVDADDSVERQMAFDLPKARSKAVLRLLTAQPSAWSAMLAANDQSAMRRALADRSLEIALSTPTVAIVGPPNVGKSTLANALFAREHSITADRPGTTRDWVGELADLNGLVVRLIDTPGVRETNDAIESAAIDRAAGVIHAADAVVAVVDGSRPLDDAERAVLANLAGRRPLIVRTKADQPMRCELAGESIDVCAIDGRGLDELRSAICHQLGVADLLAPHARCWTDEHRYKLKALLESSAASI